STYEANSTSYRTTAMVIITLQAFAGTWINAFIVSVLCIAWVKKRTFNSVEKILLFLGCCRFCFLGFTWVYIVISTTCSWCFLIHPIPQLLSAIQSFFASSNLMVSACLCGFYCIKIANFRHTFFTYMKIKIDRIVPWLMLGSVFSSLVFSFLAYSITEKAISNCFNSTTEQDSWKPSVRMDEQLLVMFVTFGFVFSTAFTVVIFSALLLLFSLWRHKSNMQTNSVKNFSVDVHIKAMKSILFFLFIYSVDFTCLVLNMINTTKKPDHVTFVILVFQYIFPTVHSLSLILSNPKLEKKLLKTLSCVKCKVCMEQ
ncbi:TA2R9 protein, partial [Trogon melanurus]|nr:TA2R9 protein [Trogon melanurus]